MICKPCRDMKHEQCPSKAAQDLSKPTMALSPESERIQLTGLCPCHHRVVFVKSDIGTEIVAQIDSPAMAFLS